MLVRRRTIISDTTTKSGMRCLSMSQRCLSTHSVNMKENFSVPAILLLLAL